MITPTRTVCYAIPEEDSEQELKVTHASPFGLEVEYLKGLDRFLNYSEVDRIIVREESVEVYYPGMVLTGDFSDLIIEPGENKRFLFRDSFLDSLSCLRPIEMPKDSFQKMYQGEWANEE